MSSQSGASHRDDGLESSVSDAVTPCQTHFKFLDLPTELRLMISEFVLFSDFEERKAISKEPLAHPLYYVSHEMQAEVESTYIKALYNYSERVRLTVNEATDKLLSLYSTSVKHSKALLESMNAGSMTSEERQAGLDVSAGLKKAIALEEARLDCAEKAAKARILEVDLFIARMDLARLTQAEKERELRESSKSA